MSSDCGKWETIFFDKISRLIWMQIKENEIVLENGKEMKHTLQLSSLHVLSGMDFG